MMADIDNFYGLIRFLKAAKREGRRPVAGVHIQQGGIDLFTALILDRKGFSRACELLTRLLTAKPAPGRVQEPQEPHRTPGEYITPSPPFDALSDLATNGWEGLTILSDRPEVLVRLSGAAREPASAGAARKTCPPGLYAKLGWGRPFIGLARFARERGIPAAAVADAVFLDESDERLYPLLRAIDLNTTLEHVPASERPEARYRCAPPEELARFFSAVPEAVANAEALVERATCDGIISPRFVFPSFLGMSDGEAFRELGRLCEEGAVRRYGGMRSDVRQRLEHELAIIREKGFASYFLVVRDIVRQCPRTCGRGSAASSIVSYLLAITHVEPLRYNLFFERFLNRGRADPPDIDVDFPWDEREAVQRYVFRAYEGRAGMVANHVCFRGRSALRDPAKALGMPAEEIDSVIRFFRLGEHERIPPYLREAAARLQGFPRNLGTHCGGVVITPGPITSYTHLQTSALGFPLIAWEKDATEDAGLVKIDLLGNRSLAVLRDTIALVARRPDGEAIDWESFDPLEDAPTRDLIAGGGTLGVFYVESPATRQLLTKMGRGDYPHLVIASSIIRPAANKYIRLFVKRLRGAPYAPLHPLVQGTLAETYGIMVYQEDVSRVAIDLAGFPIEDADRLRKILSKKDRELTLPDYREKFFAGGRSRGVSNEVLQKAWDMILSFDGYSFCKAHSASYAQVSYRVAYLKRRYPLEFIASVINNGGGFYGRQTYLDECRRMGFAVLPPDVNASAWEYTVEGTGTAGGPAAGAGEDGPAGGGPPAALRVGLCQLRDIRKPFVDRLLEERTRGGPFTGFRDFVRRTDPRLVDLRALIRSGSLDSVADGCTRPQLFFRFLNLAKEDGLGLVQPVPSLVGDYAGRVKLADEVRTLGIVVSRHPLSLFRGRIERIARRQGLGPLISSADIPRWRGRRVWIPGILVTGKEVVTKGREPMIFVSFEDETSIFETVLFPDAFRRFYPLLDDGWAFLVHGRVDEDYGSLSIGVVRLVKVSRDSGLGVGEGRAAAAAAGVVGGIVAPDRPPVFAWWSGRGAGGGDGEDGVDGDGEDWGAGDSGGWDAERLGLAAGS
jgi:DNA polymerase III alpha subunit